MLERSAIILRPKTPFWAWVNSIEPIDLGNIDQNDPEVYLVPDFMEQSEIEEWLKINFDYFFSEQLNDWYLDESLWVQNRTYEMFLDWFDYSVHTMVIDTVV